MQQCQNSPITPYNTPSQRGDLDGWRRGGIQKGGELGRRVFVSGLKRGVLLMR